MGTISIGGLATGLDTNSIVSQLTALERQRSIDPLTSEQTSVTATQSAFQTFNGKLATLLTAVNQLKDPTSVLVQTASSSDDSVLTASAAAGARPGTTEVTVNHLARPAIATSANGKTAATSSVATGSGTFAFRVGPTGTVQTIAIDATTTLQDLATKINGLGAGATASVVNVGTTANPDFRLRLGSDQEGTSQAVSIVTDDTTLGVAVSQTALDAQFTVSGFTDPLTRDSNTVSDVIPGVTFNLKSGGGPVTVTVANDTDTITSQVGAVVKAFNDIATFVSGNTTVTQDTTSDARTVTLGPLALDATSKGILESLHNIFSSPSSSAGSGSVYSVLAQIGITTNRDGTLNFDQATFQAELSSHGSDVAKLLAGSDGAKGVADRLADYINAATQSGGLIDIHNNALTDQLNTLQDRIAAGQRNLDSFQATLQKQFTNLETLVQSLKSQGSFLSAIGSRG